MVSSDADGICSAEEIFYHVIRCGLLHEACLPSNLRFENRNAIVVRDGLLVLPASLISGIVVAVVVSPVNTTESLPGGCSLNIDGRSYPLNDFWGKQAELLALYPSIA
jgi:hypothetical protein